MQQANPFDQFASDLGAAMPSTAPPVYGGPPSQASYGAPSYGAPPPAYGAPPPAYGAPPPAYGGPPPSSMGGLYGEAPGSSSPFGGLYGAPPPPPQYGAPAPPQAPPPAAPMSDPFAGFGAPAPPPAAPQDNPFGSGGSVGSGGGPPLSQAVSFGGSPMAPPPAAPAPAAVDPWAAAPQYGGALVPAEQQSNPYAQPSPFGAPPPQPRYGAPPPQPQYGAPPPQPAYDQGGYSPYGAPPPGPGAIVPAQQQSMDPFSVFEAQSAPHPGPGALVPAAQSSAMVAAPVAAAPTADDDFWGAFSASSPAPTAPVAPASGAGDLVSSSEQTGPTKNTTANAGELPPGGEMYDARIFTPTLGVMFFKPQELTDSLFLNTDKALVDGLGERPVVAFIVEGSSARSAGVELGHVLLKVNGVDVKNPKEASRLIKEGPRPLPLLFYVPNTDVVIAEGEHMVKYDTRETTAPGSAKDWKPKYCVVGGIIAQPWMLNMYRSKSEYDIAVIETQARRPVSVKVKQFSLQGARIQNDWQGPQMVKYKNKLHPWKYIVVLPVARNPIKISSPNLASLKPVHEGIRRVLLAQQRDRGAKPVRQEDQQQQSYDGQQQRY